MNLTGNTFMSIRTKLKDVSQERHPCRFCVPIRAAFRGIGQDCPANVNGSDE